MKLMIGFFGLNRSLKWTLASIKNNIFFPLRDVGYELTIVGHFNDPLEPITNRRAKEYTVKINSKEKIDQLGFDLYYIEPQPEVDPVYLDLVMKTDHYKLHDPDGTARCNIFYQLHSLNRLWTMMSRWDLSQYQGFLFFRPDLMYLDPINPCYLNDLLFGTDLITPTWHRWGGLNDRFAFCSLKGAEIYTTNRLFNLETRIQIIGGMHPESLLALVAKENNLNLGYTSMRATRIRANGRQQSENFYI